MKGGGEDGGVLFSGNLVIYLTSFANIRLVGLMQFIYGYEVAA